MYPDVAVERRPDIPRECGHGRGASGYDYLPFGQPLQNASNSLIAQRYGYTSREANPVSPLMYYRYRQYDPGVGRFTGRDLVANDNAVASVYAYVGCRPTAMADPMGLEKVWACSFEEVRRGVAVTKGWYAVKVEPRGVLFGTPKELLCIREYKSELEYICQCCPDGPEERKGKVPGKLYDAIRVDVVNFNVVLRSYTLNDLLTALRIPFADRVLPQLPPPIGVPYGRDSFDIGLLDCEREKGYQEVLCWVQLDEGAQPLECCKHRFKEGRAKCKPGGETCKERMCQAGVAR